ncbi:hypothetical protein GCM10017673_40060 [Streptosporangium violaceochromogenes]|nr:hypothetical protein GCM10017673_40060 [Streptosporangium violaceochromogenes]
MNELALTESPSLRAQYADRVEVLSRVKELTLLSDGIHADLPMVARYFEVDIEAIKKTVQRNRAELTENGLRVLKGAELAEFERDNLSLSKRRSVTLFPRRAILNAAMSLRASPVARSIRTYLLNVEELASPELRAEAIERMERAAVSRAQVLMLRAAEGFLEHDWLATKTRVVIARGLGEEPEIDPDDVPLYVPDFLKSKGLKRDQIANTQSVFGKRAAALHEAEYGFKPGKRSSETTNGSIRNTLAWTQRHLPLFEEVWDRWYAALYTPQSELFEVGS